MKINNLNFDFFKILIKKVKKLIPIFIKDESKIYMILFFIKLKKFKSFINKTYPNPQNDLNRIIENFEFWINEKKQKYKIKGFIEDTFIPSTKDTSSFYAIQQVKKKFMNL